MEFNGWNVVVWIHLLAMAFFVGGQLFVGLAVVPVFRAQGGSEGPAREWMIPIARRFGWASLGAISLSLITGAALASHLHLWNEHAMHLKLTLVAIAVVLVCIHVFITKGTNRLLQGLILLDSIAIVLAATAL